MQCEKMASVINCDASKKKKKKKNGLKEKIPVFIYSLNIFPNSCLHLTLKWKSCSHICLVITQAILDCPHSSHLISGAYIDIVTSVVQQLRLAVSPWSNWVGASPPFHLWMGTDLETLHSFRILDNGQSPQRLDISVNCLHSLYSLLDTVSCQNDKNYWHFGDCTASTFVFKAEVTEK
jgi:hypothetical protein